MDSGSGMSMGDGSIAPRQWTLALALAYQLAMNLAPRQSTLALACQRALTPATSATTQPLNSDGADRYDADGEYYDCEWHGSYKSYCDWYGDDNASIRTTIIQ
jgi:hypothetical protein